MDELTTVADLENWLSHITNGFDPSSDVVLAEVDGVLVGDGWVDWVDTTDGMREFRLGGYVHPDWQGRGIGRRLLAWQEAHASAHPAAAASTRPLVLGSWSSELNARKQRLLASAGYTPVRWFFEMLRPNLDEISVPPMPEGLEIRPAAGDREGKKRLWDADVEAFEDHWGGFDSSDAAFEAWLVRPFWDSDLWVVAWDGDEIAGAVMNTIYTADNEAFGRRRGWLDSVFVRRAWRRRGLGAALVARSLLRLREAGMSEAMLGVDSDNPSGALALYERAGFEVHRRSAAYRKPMEAS
jgi:mycothiol synthase